VYACLVSMRAGGSDDVNREIERRAHRAAADPGGGTPWPTVEARLRARLQEFTAARFVESVQAGLADAMAGRVYAHATVKARFTRR
jgi:hypothetical protein